MPEPQDGRMMDFRLLSSVFFLIILLFRWWCMAAMCVFFMENFYFGFAQVVSWLWIFAYSFRFHLSHVAMKFIFPILNYCIYFKVIIYKRFEYFHLMYKFFYYDFKEKLKCLDSLVVDFWVFLIVILKIWK